MSTDVTNTSTNFTNISSDFSLPTQELKKAGKNIGDTNVEKKTNFLAIATLKNVAYFFMKIFFTPVILLYSLYSFVARKLQGGPDYQSIFNAFFCKANEFLKDFNCRNKSLLTEQLSNEYVMHKYISLAYSYRLRSIRDQMNDRNDQMVTQIDKLFDECLNERIKEKPIVNSNLMEKEKEKEKEKIMPN